MALDLLGRLERLASRRAGAVVLAAVALSVYAARAVAWPLRPGRDLDEYLYFYIQLFDRDVLLPWSMLFRTPGTPVVAGPLLDLWGGILAEPAAALLFAGSVVAWSAVALAWGPRAALLTAATLLVYPGWGAMFHELGSELVMAAAFSLFALLLVRRRFALAGLALAAVVLVRPGNIVLLPLAAVPLLLGGSWRDRGIRAGTFALAAVAPLAAWTLVNGARFDHWALARGGNAVIPFYRAFLTDRIVSPEHGPESRRLGEAVEQHLLTREPYRSYDVTLDEVFSAGSARVHEDMYLLSDEVFGWDTDYSVLRDAAVEAIEDRPGDYASGVLDTFWQQLSEPFYRVVGGARPQPEPVSNSGLPPPTEGQLIPAGQNLWISRPDNAIREEWPTPTTHRFVFDRPADRSRFEEIVREREELFAGFPDRDGSAWLGNRLNQLGRWFPRPGLFLLAGLLAIALRRPRDVTVPLALAGGALLVVLLNALGLPPDPHYVLPVAPAFVLVAAVGLLGQRREDRLDDAL
jgi:hypothetical protein